MVTVGAQSMYIWLLYVVKLRLILMEELSLLNTLVSLDLFFNLITATMSSKFYINYTLDMATVSIEASSGMLRTNIPMKSVIIYVGN